MADIGTQEIDFSKITAKEAAAASKEPFDSAAKAVQRIADEAAKKRLPRIKSVQAEINAGVKRGEDLANSLRK